MYADRPLLTLASVLVLVGCGSSPPPLPNSARATSLADLLATCSGPAVSPLSPLPMNATPNEQSCQSLLALASQLACWAREAPKLAAPGAAAYTVDATRAFGQCQNDLAGLLEGGSWLPPDALAGAVAACFDRLQAAPAPRLREPALSERQQFEGVLRQWVPGSWTERIMRVWPADQIVRPPVEPIPVFLARQGRGAHASWPSCRDAAALQLPPKHTTP